MLLAVIGIIATNYIFGGIAISSTLFGQFMAAFISINVALFVFNLIPIPPLDGSRVLYAFAPDPIRRVMEQMEPYGLFVVFGLIILGFGSFIGNWIQAVQNFLLSIL